jgi:hypothetical protein
MKKKLIQIGVLICIIILIIIGIRLIKSTNKGTPNQDQKGKPLTK